MVQICLQAPTNLLPVAHGLPEKLLGQPTFSISCTPGSFEKPISVARRSYQSDCQRIYNLSTRFQYTIASYTPRIPSVKADNMSSVTRFRQTELPTVLFSVYKL